MFHTYDSFKITGLIPLYFQRIAMPIGYELICTNVYPPRKEFFLMHQNNASEIMHQKFRKWAYLFLTFI